ncbi:hypothetical protein [Oceanobacillus sp. 1P07AA]|uniref:hypothetical protein n=1 Tax=Oceanobacillus sp. 1P07AA TaxID=3132293 RepID=UPI0039A63A50
MSENERRLLHELAQRLDKQEEAVIQLLRIIATTNKKVSEISPDEKEKVTT